MKWGIWERDSVSYSVSPHGGRLAMIRKSTASHISLHRMLDNGRMLTVETGYICVGILPFVERFAVKNTLDLNLGKLFALGCLKSLQIQL
mgnify:CR=1 FL=1